MAPAAPLGAKLLFGMISDITLSALLSQQGSTECSSRPESIGKLYKLSKSIALAGKLVYEV